MIKIVPVTKISFRSFQLISEFIIEDPAQNTLWENIITADIGGLNINRKCRNTAILKI